ncbi:MAG: sterol desaturase family protein [Myxococcales bacterium]|nr:sterol desaturase family protein [Myxococcales bacterium]
MGIIREVARRATVAIVLGSLPAFFALVDSGVAPLSASGFLLGAMAVMLLGLEFALPRGGLGERPTGTMVVDVIYTGLSAALNVLLPALILVPLLGAHSLTWNGAPLWPQDLPRWLDVTLCVLLADFVSYWWHRLEHDERFAVLWRLHGVHHAPRYFDFWMGAHVHPLDVIVFATLTAGLAAFLGVPTLTIDATMLLAAVVGGMHHLNAQTDCGWLNRLIPFADHHAVHHSRAKVDNGNFGNITTLFDQLFGTWIPPRPTGDQPTGAWSLAEDYPHTDFVFQILSPFGRYWRRAKGGSAPSQPDANETLDVEQRDKQQSSDPACSNGD